MSTFVPLAHGVFGIWDELIPVFILIGFGVFVVLSAIVGHARNNALAKTQDTPTTEPDHPSDPMPRSDHFRLD